MNKYGKQAKKKSKVTLIWDHSHTRHEKNRNRIFDVNVQCNDINVNLKRFINAPFAFTRADSFQLNYRDNRRALPKRFPSCVEEHAGTSFVESCSPFAAAADEKRTKHENPSYRDWSIASESFRVISACISTCFHRVRDRTLLSEGVGRGEGAGERRLCRTRGEEGLLRSLDRYTAITRRAYWSNDSQAHGSQNPSFSQPSLFLQSPALRPDTLSFREGEKARPRKGQHVGKQESCAAWIYIYTTGE